jgi:hypothetical protein
MNIMFYDAERIKKWTNDIIGIIAQLADLDFQKKAWIEGKTWLSISLDETSCQLYDDSSFRHFLKECANENWLTEPLLEKLKKFDTDFNKYIDDHSTHYYAVLEMQTDPEWHKIQRFAHEILEDFKTLGYHPPDLTKLPYLDPIQVNIMVKIIAHISDLEEQKKTWMEGKRLLPTTFAEVVGEFYNDSKFRKLIEEREKEHWFRQSVIDNLKKFNIEFQIYLEKHGAQNIDEIDLRKNSDWLKIQCFTREILGEFKECGFTPSS